MNKLILGILLLLGWVALPTKVSAHILVTDTTGQYGAILHVMPDDDPIAGEESNLFYDVQIDSLDDSDYEAILTITNSSDELTIVNLETNDSYMSTNYAFPTQGVYRLKLQIKTSSASYNFESSQRVSRGVTAVASQASNRYAWAELGLVAALSGLVMVAIVGFNYRHKIATYSRQ